MEDQVCRDISYNPVLHRLEAFILTTGNHRRTSVGIGSSGTDEDSFDVRETLFVKPERTLHSIAAVGLRGVRIPTGQTREGCAGCAGLGNAFYLLVALGWRCAAEEFEMICMCSVVDERFKRGEGGRDRDVERRDWLAWLALRCASAECGGDEMEQDGAYVGQGA